MKMISKAILTLAAVGVMAVPAMAIEKLAVKSGTTSVFSVDDAGMASATKVGAGTVTPKNILHVHAPNALGQTTLVGSDKLYSLTGAGVLSAKDNGVGYDFVVADSTGQAGYGGGIRGVRARGDFDTPAAPILDDITLNLNAGAWDGGKVYNSAQVAFKIDGTVGTSTVPQRIVFNLRNNGAGAFVERLVVKANGNVGLSIPALQAPTALLDVNSDIIRLRNSKVPSGNTAACNQGDISWGTAYVYVCVATNSWKRAAFDTTATW